jgi:hypothetical protein
MNLLPVLLLATLLADDPPALHSAPYGRPAEFFVTGCDLILSGHEVTKVSNDGKRGYLIVKTKTSVSVNNRVVISSTDQALTSTVIDPKIEAESAVIEAAVEYLWINKKREANANVVNGTSHPLGAPFELSLPTSGEVVEVTFTEDGRWLWVSYHGNRAFFPIEKPVIQPEDPEQRLDICFQLLSEDLKPGFLIIKGGGYLFRFPLSRAEEVRASLARIPDLAEFVRVDNYGRPTYKPIYDGEFLWGSSIVQDFLP